MKNLHYLYICIWLAFKNVISYTNCGVSLSGSLEEKTRLASPLYWEDMPWLLKFQSTINGYTIYCGGSFISYNEVITSAMCIKEILKGENLKLSLPSSKRFKINYAHHLNIINVSIHPNFSLETMENNIAIVRLQIDSYIRSYIHPVCISANDENLLNQKVIVAGPGKNAAQINIQQVECCRFLLFNDRLLVFRKIYRPFNMSIDEKCLCAGSRGKGISEGDAGSPLFANSYSKWYQIGLLSNGLIQYDLAIENQDRYPAVYTRLSKYCDFIERYSFAKCLNVNMEPGFIGRIIQKIKTFVFPNKCPSDEFQEILIREILNKNRTRILHREF